MILINMSHPLTEANRAEIEQITRRKIERMADIPVQFDMEEPFAAQAVETVDRYQEAVAKEQADAVLLVLPSHSAIAAVVIAEIYGRSGRLPTVVRFQPDYSVIPSVFKVAEVIDLYALRDQARRRRREV